MPTESILFLGLVIGALVQFAAALSYAEWATRHAADKTPRRSQVMRNASVNREEPITIRKAA